MRGGATIATGFLLGLALWYVLRAYCLWRRS